MKDTDGSFRTGILQDFQISAGIRFRSLALLDLSFTHRSFCNENPAHLRNNERLEFLGDAILGMIVANRLFSLFAAKPEGELARIKSFIVSEDTLSRLGFSLGLDRLLLLGKGEELSGGRKKKAIMADALESVIGAYFLDSGLDTVSEFVLGLVDPEIEKVIGNRHRKDYKTIVQEYSQKYHQTIPVYIEGPSTGPDHDRTFRVSCMIGSKIFEQSEGKNKKEAEQSAACSAYESILSEGGAEAARLLDIEEH